MKKIVLLIFLFFRFNSCRKESKIEIYLLKHPVTSYEGVCVGDMEFYNKLPDSIKEIYPKLKLKEERYDVKDSSFIYGGAYNIKIDDLDSLPFITDDRIVSFDSYKNEFVFDSVAANKIYKLKVTMKRGCQFVVTVNKRPVLNGYFWSVLSSYRCNSFCIYYSDSKSIKTLDNAFVDKHTGNRRHFTVYFGPLDKSDKEKNRPRYSRELIEALQETNRLLK